MTEGEKKRKIGTAAGASPRPTKETPFRSPYEDAAGLGIVHYSFLSASSALSRDGSAVFFPAFDFFGL